MSAPVSVRLWRVAGALAVAHVALMLGGNSVENTPPLGDARSTVLADYVTGPMGRAYAGGYVEFLGFLAFLAGAVLIGRLLRGRTETSGWLARCIDASAVTYVAVTVATGFAAGAAALYDGHHGATLATITTVNDIRNFGYFLSIGVLGAFTLSVAAAGQVTRALPRWLSWTGYVLGVAMIASVPTARVGGIDYASLAWLVWFLALAVVALRGLRRVALPEERELAAAGR
jgi:hypothetical protein